MSKMSLYAVLDTKAGAFNNPNPIISRGAAIRAFTDAIASGNSDFSKHPEDYVLFCLGEFDNNTGVITPLPAPESVIGAWECLAQS